MSDERGYSLVELLVATIAGIVVFSAIMGLITVTTQHNQFVADRVAANQRARPVMTQVMNTLHSACVAPAVAPVQSGSTDSSMVVLSKSGSAVNPTPDRRVVTLTGTTLSEQVFPANGGAAPTWTFSGTASETRELLTGVSTTPGVPLFRYYEYVNGAISPTPLTTPLSAASAARTVQVTVTFGASPTTGGVATADAKAPIVLSDSAILRLSAASEDLSEVNTPCV